MIIDTKTFDETSKIKKQVLCRNGEDNENVIYSLLILEEEKGQPKKVIYRWVRKPAHEGGRSGVFISEEEHIYQGEMSNHRKHGEGEYIIIQKLSNSSEKHCGIWELGATISSRVERWSQMTELNVR
jgi:hypothetical protein